MINIVCALPFDPMPAVSPIRIDSSRAVVVAGQLLTAKPADLTERTQRMADAVRERRDVVEAILRRRTRQPGGLRPVLAALDTAWGGLVQRLLAAHNLPPTDELCAIASRVLHEMRIDGLESLRTTTPDKVVQSGRMLGIVDEKHLAADIDRVAGPSFLAAVRSAHAGLVEALGLGAGHVPYAPTELGIALANLRKAMQLYAIGVAAETDPGSEESVRRFNDSVSPIVRARAERPDVSEEEDVPTDDLVTPTTDPTTTPVSPTTSDGTTNGVAHS